MRLLKHIFMNEAGEGDGGTGGSDTGSANDTSSSGGGSEGVGSGDTGGSTDASSNDSGNGDNSSPPGQVEYFKSLPDDWRKQVVAATGLLETDEQFEKRVKQLERVSDIGTLGKNYFEAQDRIRKGEISNGLPENPTDEQIASWREANGIPESAEGYELKLDEGLVLGDADSRVMNQVFNVAHENNISAETMNQLTNAMLKARQVEAEALQAQDGVDQQTTDRMLKDTWGGDYQANINMVQGLINTLPETVREAFASARMPDGKAVFNSPEMMIAMEL